MLQKIIYPLLIIPISILLIVLCLYRYNADICFEKARICANRYARFHNKEYLALTQYYYDLAVKYNFFEFYNYSARVNGMYIKTLINNE